MYSFGSEALLCGSELSLFLAGGLTHDCAMSVRWEPEHKITLLVSTARFVDCLRQYLWSVHEPRKPPPNRTCEAELELFGWMAMPPPVNAHHWIAHTGGFPASWTEHRFCLRQATIWAVDSRRWFCVQILIAHSSHNRESAPQWGIEPGQIRRGICCCFKNALRDDETQWTNPQNTPIL